MRYLPRAPKAVNQIVLIWALSAALALSLLLTPPAQAQEWPDHPRGLELVGMSIPLIERGRSRGVIRMDLMLETTAESNFPIIVSNETRLRNSLIQVVSAALHARPSSASDLDLDFITAQILSECRRLFGENQVVNVLFTRVIISTS